MEVDHFYWCYYVLFILQFRCESFSQFFFFCTLVPCTDKPNKPCPETSSRCKYNVNKGCIKAPGVSHAYHSFYYCYCYYYYHYYSCRHHGRYMGLRSFQVCFSKTRSRFTFNPFSIVNERRVSRVREHNINVYSLSVCHALKYIQKQGRPPSVFFNRIIHDRPDG